MVVIFSFVEQMVACEFNRRSYIAGKIPPASQTRKGPVHDPIFSGYFSPRSLPNLRSTLGWTTHSPTAFLQVRLTPNGSLFEAT